MAQITAWEAVSEPISREIDHQLRDGHEGAGFEAWLWVVDVVSKP